MKKTFNCMVLTLCITSLFMFGNASAETIKTRIGDVSFTHDFANGYPTVAGKAWFPYFRLYSPKQAFLDQTWVLPDIEKR